MPLVLAVALIGSIIGLHQGWFARGGGGTSYVAEFERGADGSYAEADRGIFEPESKTSAKASLRIRWDETPQRAWFTQEECCWSRMVWSLDVKPPSSPSAPAAPLTPADRAQIASKMFGLVAQPVLPAGASAAPVPGETNISGTETEVHWGLTAVWLLRGTPGLSIVVWLAVGAGAWFTRDDGRRAMLCGHCRYDRTGIAADAVCPECGKAPWPDLVLPHVGALLCAATRTAHAPTLSKKLPFLLPAERLPEVES